MFTKSGKNLIRLSIPSKKESLSPSISSNEIYPINGHIDNSILEGVEIKRTLSPPLELELKPSVVVEKHEPIDEKTEPLQSPLNKNSSLDQFLSFLSKKENEKTPKQEPIQTSSPRATSWSPTEQIETTPIKQQQQVYTAPKTVNTNTIPPVDKKPRPSVTRKKIAITKPFQTRLPSASENDDTKTPLSLTTNEKNQTNVEPPLHYIRKFAAPTNDDDDRPIPIPKETIYMLYKPPKNPVKRERSVQAPDANGKECGIQCDFSEDSLSSESECSQIDDDQIIEECEFIEDSNLYECHVCGEVCSSNSARYKHTLTHNDSSLLCYRCGALFPDSAKLLAHELQVHPDQGHTTKKLLRCPKTNCLKAYHSKVQLYEHIDQHGSRTNEQRCGRCQRLFQTPLQLLSHIKRKICWR